MKSATMQSVHAPVFTTITRDDQQVIDWVKGRLSRVAAILSGWKNERYVMRGEEQLRGPLADEYRRAHWF